MITEIRAEKRIRASVRRKHLLRTICFALSWFICEAWPRVGAEERERSGDRWSDAPIWQLDIRPPDFQPLPIVPGRPVDNGTSRQMFFTSESALVTAFVTPISEPSEPEKKNQDHALKWLLHATVIDATTGRVQITKEWSIDSPRSRIMPDGRDGLLVLSPGRIIRYSSELEPTKELPLTYPKRTNGDMPDVLQSPSGKAILLRFCDNADPSSPEGWFTGHYDFIWIDAQTLTVARSWSEPESENTWHGSEYVMARGGSAMTISDNEIAWGVDGAVLVRRLDQPWRLICYLRPECGSPEFVSNDYLLTHFWNQPSTKSNKSIEIMSSEGRTILRQQIAYKDTDSLGLLRVSANGRRFALVSYSDSGEIDFADFHLRSSHQTVREVLVLDIPSGRRAYSLHPKHKIKGTAGGPFPLQGLALSPDGSQMAIFFEHILQVFRLPGLRPE